jgi:hypothetical protein
MVRFCAKLSILFGQPQDWRVRTNAVKFRPSLIGCRVARPKCSLNCIESTCKTPNRPNGYPRATQGLPNGYPRDAQGLPNGYPRDAQGPNTLAIPAQSRSNALSPRLHRACIVLAPRAPHAIRSEPDARARPARCPGSLGGISPRWRRYWASGRNGPMV